MNYASVIWHQLLDAAERALKLKPAVGYSPEIAEADKKAREKWSAMVFEKAFCMYSALREAEYRAYVSCCERSGQVPLSRADYFAPPAAGG